MARDTVIWAVVVLLAAVAAAPFVVERLRTAGSGIARDAAPGQFAALRQGTTQYRLRGPVDGPLVVCVHGLTTPSFVWDPLADRLVARGFRVLVYDLYGRGFSDRPGGRQDEAFFITQLDDLLAHLEIETPFHLMGYSMGGAIAACYSATYPARIRDMVLLASGGFHIPKTTRIPFIPEGGMLSAWLLYAFYPMTLRRGIAAERAGGTVVAAISDGQEAQLEFRGFIPAVVSSLHGLLATTRAQKHRDICSAGLPVLAIWAAEDDVIPARARERLSEWNPDARQEIIAQAGHGVTYTHPDALLAHITDFLPPVQDTSQSRRD